jgi:hypothetical protein
VESRIEITGLAARVKFAGELKAVDPGSQD